MVRKLEVFPIFTGQDWWKIKPRQPQILSQKFATVLNDEDVSNADSYEEKGFKIRPRRPASMKASGSSEFKINKEWFQITLDLDYEFEEKEISVKTFNRTVEVRAKHEEKGDQYGLVSREFCRQYKVPNECDIDALTSTLSLCDYKLTIKAPIIQGANSLVDIPVRVPVFEEKSEAVTVLDGNEFRKCVQQLCRQVSAEKTLIVDHTPSPVNEHIDGSAKETDGQGEPKTDDDAGRLAQ